MLETRFKEYLRLEPQKDLGAQNQHPVFIQCERNLFLKFFIHYRLYCSHSALFPVIRFSRDFFSGSPSQLVGRSPSKKESKPVLLCSHACYCPLLFWEGAGGEGEEVGAALVSVLLFSEPGAVVAAEVEPPVVVSLEESAGAGPLTDVLAALLDAAGAVDDDEAAAAAELDASEAAPLAEVEFMAESRSA